MKRINECGPTFSMADCVVIISRNNIVASYSCCKIVYKVADAVIASHQDIQINIFAPLLMASLSIQSVQILK